MTVYVRDVSYGFKNRKVIDGFTADFEAGSVSAITGPSGSGKTTLLNLVGGLMAPDTGRVLFRDEDIAAMSARAARKFRKAHVGYLFQDYGLVPDLSVRENLKIAVPHASRAGMSAVLNELGLEGVETRTASELSGGEQQRVALARLILGKPEIVLADEPTGSLDQANSEVVLRRLRGFARDGAVVVVATHSRYIADNSDKVVEL